MLLIEDRVLMG